MAKTKSRPEIGEPTGFEEIWRERRRDSPSQADPEDDSGRGLPRYLRAISRAPFLPAWVETLLFERMEAGSRGAKARLVVSHLRLVASIAGEHLDRGLSIEDLIQEGNLGLERAVEKFDFRRGTRLSSYATPAIETAIVQAIADTGRTIRVPLYARRRLARIARAEDLLWSEFRRPPTREELAEVTGYTQDEIDWLRRDTLPPSLLSELSWDETEEFLDWLPDANQLTPEQEYLEWETAEMLDTALEKLSDRERRIVKWRVGWESAGSRSLAEIALQMGISRERVRQIEEEALAKLRSIIEASERRAQWPGRIGAGIDRLGL